MKKLLVFSVLVFLLSLTAGPVAADPNLYFDFDNDGVYDVSWQICGKETVEIYLDDWDTSGFSSEPLLGVQMFFYYDDTKLKVNMENSYPNDTIHGGPFEPTLSLPQNLGGGKIKLLASEFACVAITDRILLWTLELEGIAGGSSDISIQVDLDGDPVHGAVSPGGMDCSVPHQEDAGNGVATISVPDGVDTDEDGLADECDNCPETPNPNQEDTYPPGGNGIGDACECEGDFNCNGTVDAEDVTTYLIDFGRNQYIDPCENGNQCNGDFDCNGAVDATDVTKLYKALTKRDAITHATQRKEVSRKENHTA